MPIWRARMQSGESVEAIETITGKRAPFIQPNMTRPVKPREKPSS